MEIKELRVGSWIFDEDGILCKINGFQPYGHSVRCDEEEGCLVLIDLYPQDESVRRGYECNLNSVKPIPLTEEVLLRCGFEAHKSNHFWFRKDALCVSITGVVELIYWNKIPFKLDIEIKQLHQLQNLYYSICGEELTYNHSPSI